MRYMCVLLFLPLLIYTCICMYKTTSGQATKKGKTAGNHQPRVKDGEKQLCVVHLYGTIWNYKLFVHMLPSFVELIIII